MSSHIFTRKSRLRPGEFLITGEKGLLQQNLPTATDAAQQNGVSFDNLVGNGEHARRNCKAECLCRPEMNHKSTLVGCITGKVGRLCSCDDPAGIHANLAICVGQVRTVAYEATSR